MPKRNAHCSNIALLKRAEKVVRPPHTPIRPCNTLKISRGGKDAVWARNFIRGQNADPSITPVLLTFPPRFSSELVDLFDTVGPDVIVERQCLGKCEKTSRDHIHSHWYFKSRGENPTINVEALMGHKALIKEVWDTDIELSEGEQEE